MNVDDLTKGEARDVMMFLARRAGAEKMSIRKIGADFFVIVHWRKKMVSHLHHWRSPMFFFADSWKECLRKMLDDGKEVFVNRFIGDEDGEMKVENDVVFWSPEENLEKLLIEKDLMKDGIA